MSDISVIGNAIVGNVQTTPPTSSTSAVEVTAPAVEAQEVVRADQVEFSEQAQWLEKIHQLPEVRQDHVDALKEAIASNSFLTDEKLQVAFDRLIQEVAK